MSLTEKATKPHFYCSKCGYHGEKSNHKRPGADAPCNYFAIEAEATKPQEPVAWVDVVDRHEGPYKFHGKELLDSGKHNLFTTPQHCQRCADRDSSPQPLWPDDDPMVVAMAERIAELEAGHAKSEEAWESLDTERVRYMNDVGDVLGQNNTDESLIDAARRVMTTIEFQKKAWGADFVRMTRMEAAIERMRIAGGKDEFQKAFDDAKGLL